MEKVSLNVPKMYADHHVIAVRELLLQSAGVEEVYASSAFKRVLIAYDPVATSPEALQELLGQAGYGVADPLQFPPLTPGKDDGSFWHTWYPRETKTNRLDIEMSGDFRKY